ncbi:hypothetical protein PoB_003131000 [Plakobranchus ocellatus]|uniref:Uncharacterized protein n=1 Tax=Plakobranchus ocellatus TaxID=259542 RepID=A0AAV4ABR6_9GAST|nr:hypothetical protein PoB_003131000 [Plakobranchus ocellatus]
MFLPILRPDPTRVGRTRVHSDPQLHQDWSRLTLFGSGYGLSRSVCGHSDLSYVLHLGMIPRQTIFPIISAILQKQATQIDRVRLQRRVGNSD